MADVPDVKVIVVVRDPVTARTPTGRTCGLTGWSPRPTPAAALRAEQERIDGGWAPFWHYRDLGRYGGQLQDLYRHVPRSG